MSGRTVRAFHLLLPVLCVVVVLALVVLWPTSGAKATATWQITRLTDNSVWDYAQDIAEGYAVWNHADGHDTELYLRDLALGTNRQITDNETDDLAAILDGGRLAWENRTVVPPGGIYTQIMLMAVPDGKPVALTSGDYWRLLTDNRHGNICWHGHGDAATGSIEVFHYYVGTGVTTQLTSDAVTDLFPKSDGINVVYTKGTWTSVPLMGIMVYKLGTGITQELTPSSNLKEINYLLHDSGKLLYTRHDGKDFDIWMADLRTNTRMQISDNSYDDTPWGLSHNTLVAWSEMRPSGSDDVSPQYRLHLFDIATRTEVWVSGFMFNLARVDFEGDLLVWSAAETATADKEIWVFDCSDGTVTQLTNNDYEDHAVHTDGRRILWTGDAGAAPLSEPWNRHEVFLAEPYTPPATTPLFLDVPETHPYRTAIEGLRVAGVIGGYETSTGWEFRPAAPAFRAQFAKMICETLGLQVPANLPCPFTDLGPDDPNNLYPHQYVAMAAAKGITSGTGQNRFSPYSNIFRAQVVTMIVRAADSLAPGALQAPSSAYAGTLGDFSPAHAESMRKAEYNGLLNGLASFGKGWDPWAPATRGEMAAMLWALKKLLP